MHQNQSIDTTSRPHSVQPNNQTTSSLDELRLHKQSSVFCSSNSHSDLGRANDYRIFNCALCHQQVKICRRCDHRHRYCKQCSAVAQKESKKRRRTKYQASPKGQEQHRLGAQRYRQRHKPNKTSLQRAIDNEITTHAPVELEACGAELLAVTPALVNENYCGPEDRLEPSEQRPLPEHHQAIMPSVADLPILFLVPQNVSTATEGERQEQAIAILPVSSLGKVSQCDVCGASCGPFTRRLWKQKKQRLRAKRRSSTLPHILLC